MTAGALNDYIETQVHGGVDLARDVGAHRLPCPVLGEEIAEDGRVDPRVIGGWVRPVPVPVPVPGS